MKPTSAARLPWWWALTCTALLGLAVAACRSTGSTDTFEEDSPSGADAAGAADTSSAQDPLSEAVARAQERDERSEVLAKRYVSRGQRNLETGNLEEAREDFASALELDPTNAEARSGYNRVRARLGDPAGTVGTALEQSVERRRVQLQEARMRADRAFKAGQAQYDLGNYEAAIRHFEDALAVLNWFPYDLDTTYDKNLVRDYIDRAGDKLEEEREARERDLAEKTEAEKRAEAERAAQDVRARINRLFADANRHFERGNFQVSARLAEQILRLEPDNRRAKKLVRLSNHAYHNRKHEELLREYAEEWRLVFEELRASLLPQNQIVRFPENWEEKQALRRPRQFTTVGAETTAEEARVRNLLSSVKISPDFEEEPLQDVTDFLHNISGINFVVTRAVTDELSDAELDVSLSVEDISMANALDLITGLKGLVWRVEDSVVKITTATDVSGDVYLELYNVRDLTTPIVDYPGEEIYLEGSTGFETFDDFGDELDEPEPAIQADRLVQLIQDNILRGSWDFPASIEPREGVLIVMQTREVHRMIREMLDDLRGSQGLLVHIEARFLTVEDNFLEDVGVDFRGLGDDTGGGGAPGRGSNEPLDDIEFGTPSQPLGGGTDSGSGVFYNDGQDGDIRGRVENLLDQTLGEDGVLTGSGGLSAQFTYLDDTEVEAILRAVQKSERVNTIVAPSLIISNNERASLSAINQISYIKDFDVEIAQAAQIADPIVDVISDGVILDVRPVVHPDRRFITLELRPTVSQLVRPIPERDVSFAVGNSGRLQLPELEVQRVRTTVTVPDGGTLLLGGLKIAQERDVQSGVPILSEIPIISFFFNRKGQFKRYKNLMVLLRARVVIMNEHEPGVAVGR